MFDHVLKLFKALVWYVRIFPFMQFQLTNTKPHVLNYAKY